MATRRLVSGAEPVLASARFSEGPHDLWQIGTPDQGDAGHLWVDASETKIVLVDDLRSFVDGRRAEVARTSAAGVELLDRYQDRRLDELWLDHALDEDDTIWPVVEVLERAAFEDCPFDIGVINVHSANPAGAAKIAQVLRHWATGSRLRPGPLRSVISKGPPVRSDRRSLA